jgi:hypothetical protein
MDLSRVTLLALVGTAIAGCESLQDGSASEETTTSTSEPDRIGENENPALLIPGASSRLDDNIAPEDVGETFGTDDAHIPYPDTYWPFSSGGIDQRWASGPSALEKYMSVADPDHARDAKRWERENHGRGVPHVKSWFGHCEGWVAAALSTAPIEHAVHARSDGAGGLESCRAADADCTRFEIGDVNALAAEVYVDGEARLIGARCDVKPKDIERDADGRIVRGANGCHGLNPGALLVVLGQKMKRLQEPLAIDAQTDSTTDQIWNQPAYRYTVHRYDTLTTEEAANLVAYGTRTGDRTAYDWNEAAKGFVFVDIGIHWVKERGPNTRVVSGASSTKETRFAAVIELDSTSTRGGARIIGGEYLDDRSARADRLDVPPFVWTAEGIGPESLPSSADGTHHNPYVRPSLVSELVRLGTEPQ